MTDLEKVIAYFVGNAERNLWAKDTKFTPAPDTEELIVTAERLLQSYDLLIKQNTFNIIELKVRATSCRNRFGFLTRESNDENQK